VSHFAQKRQRSPSPDDLEIEEISSPSSHINSTQSTPDLKEIALPVVHLGSGRSRTDPELARLDVQPHSTINNAIDQLTELLAAFCFERLEMSANPTDDADSTDVDTSMDTLTEELRVSDLLQYYTRN